MIIIPAIDLKDGRCVRLFQGRMSEETVYSENPIDVAKKWQSEGAQRIHIVDLNGAIIGKPYHYSLIKDIAKSLSIPIEVGGGIRDLETIEKYLSFGVQWVILGTMMLKNPLLIEEASRRFPERIILAIDLRKGKVSIKGWTEEASVGALDLIKSFEDVGISSIILTDIERDGMERGLNFEMIRSIATSIRLPLIASGGVSTIEDIKKLTELEPLGVMGVIIGRALYNGSINLKEAIQIISELSS
jgi:phosphoribosylformimino-5-aminoimidazole carboxamide ribotide isomerase